MRIEIGEFKTIARFIARRPMWTAALTAVLSLGIGANLAVFSVLDSLVLRPLRLSNERGLVSILDEQGTNGQQTDYTTFQLLSGSAHSFSGLAASLATSVSVRDDANVDLINASLITPRYFELLGVRAARGRLITSAVSEGPSADAVVVISHRLWQSRFAGSKAVIGRTMQIAGQIVTIIGVADAPFAGIRLSGPIDLWLPVSLAPHLQLGLLSRFHILAPNSRARLFDVFGRLYPGISDEKAAADLARVATSDQDDGRRFTIAPLTSTVLPAHSRAELVSFLRLAWLVAGLTLLLACANVGNLILVRGSKRRRELGIRLALGASRGSILRLLLLESLALGLIGTLAGVALCGFVVHSILPVLAPASVPAASPAPHLDWHLFLVSVAFALTSCAAFGIFPAISVSSVRAVEAMGQRSDGPRVRRWHGMLVSVQVAVCIVLLVGAALMLRSLALGLTTDLGFDPAPIAAVSIQPRFEGRRIDNARRYAEIVARVGTIPGVRNVAAMTHVPVAPTRFLPFGVGPASSTEGEGRTVSLPMESVSNGYFDVLGMRILAGRRFDQRDGPETERVTIVNEAAARMLWPGESAVGKQINFLNSRTYTIVGVMRDTRLTSLDERSVPFAVAPLSQEEVKGLLTFAVRSGNPRQALVSLQRVLDDFAPEFKMLHPRLVSGQVRALLAPQQVGAVLLSAFSFISACICCAGIYGTLAYTNARRRTELGIRSALGASGRDLLSAVALSTVRFVGIGFIIGAVAAALVARTLTHFLFGVTAHDVTAFSVAGLAMALAVFASAFRPVLAAIRTDPIVAIRTES